MLVVNDSFLLFHFQLLNIIKVLIEHSQADLTWKIFLRLTGLLLTFLLLMIFTENLQVTFTNGEYSSQPSIAILMNLLLFPRSWIWGKIYSFSFPLETHIPEKIAVLFSLWGNIQDKESQSSLASATLIKMKLFSFFLHTELSTQLCSI